MLDTKTMDEVAAVGSKLKKEELLGKLDEGSLKFLRWALDPAITFGVIVDSDDYVDLLGKVKGRLPPKNREKWWEQLDNVFGMYSRRELTGNQATDVWRELMLVAFEVNDIVWACRVLNKDLRAGFSVSTLNKAHPDCIAPFAVALAKPYEPDKHEIRGDWCVEPKLDGLRMVVVDGVAYTRNGRVIESVGHILDDLMPFRSYVFDGEIMGAAEFNEDSGNIRRKGEGPNLTLKYNVFDCVEANEWGMRKTRSYGQRRRDLVGLLSKKYGKYIETVESRVLKNDPTAEELFALRDYYIGKGYEGAMIKRMDAPYVFKRSDNILKLKDFQDADGKVTGWYEGKGRHKGRLGGLIAKFDGVETRVGSGFSDAQRDELWEVAEANTDLIGKVIEVQYQNKTPDGSLRFPVFIKFRPDKE